MTVRRLLAVALLAVAVHQVPAAAAAPPVEITGATFAELDDATGRWTLRGAPVLIRRGAVTVRAPAIVYDSQQQIIRGSGGVVYDDGALRLEAGQITVWVADERLLAEDRVTAIQTREGLRMAAGRLEAFGKERRVVATGSPVVTSSEGAITADRIELLAELDELVAEGSVRLVREDVEGLAPHLVLRRRDAVAVLSGGAVVRQGANEARAQTITLDLHRRRITATGGATIRVQVGP